MSGGDLFLDGAQGKGLLKKRQGTGGTTGPAKKKGGGKKKAAGDGGVKVSKGLAAELRSMAKTLGIAELDDDQLESLVAGASVETTRNGEPVSLMVSDEKNPTAGLVIEESFLADDPGPRVLTDEEKAECVRRGMARQEEERAAAAAAAEGDGGTAAAGGEDEEPLGDVDQVLEHVRALGFSTITAAEALDVLGGEDLELERDEDGGRYLVGRYDDSLHVRATPLEEGDDLYSNPEEGAGEAQDGQEGGEEPPAEPEDPPPAPAAEEPPAAAQEAPEDMKALLASVQRARAIDREIRGLEADWKEAKDHAKEIKDEIDEKSKELRETIRHTDPGPLFDRRPKCARCEERSAVLDRGPLGTSWSDRQVCPTCQRVLREEKDAADRGAAAGATEEPPAGETTREAPSCALCEEGDEPQPRPGQDASKGLYHDTADGWEPCPLNTEVPGESPFGPVPEEREGEHGVDREKLKFTRKNVQEAFDELIERHGWDRVAWTLAPDYRNGLGLTKKIAVGDVRDLASTLDG